ncbi:hemerythrin domain-containing protein [Nonomuraea lactucae]|uniref:hemerythrin domain-containing protein n=1 Tax=Nonomuraea lactucae TaxID=2249762 RepID=UPI0013B408F4|nr:hemerythrin domain-containing protein [Nonomuraea lactucae]
MPLNVIDLITADHRDVEAIFDKLYKQPENRPALLAELAAKFTAHARAEESEVYSELAKAAPSERREVHHGTEEHHEAEEKLLELLDTDPTGPAFEPILKDLVKAVTHHVEEEESEILPALAKALPAKRLAELAHAFSAAKAALLNAPPRPVTRTKRELLEQAKAKGIDGYSAMTKGELAAALKH